MKQTNPKMLFFSNLFIWFSVFGADGISLENLIQVWFMFEPLAARWAKGNEN